MKLRFDGAWENGRWVEPAFVDLDSTGKLERLSNEALGQASQYEAHPGYALPGLFNGHSHAFQYAMAGMSESLTPEHDSFWTWREKMYQLALSLEPETMYCVASMLYAEMLRLGFTHVVEFHYLHHDPSGKPYDNLAEMAVSLSRAADRTGMGLTMVPIYYESGDFGRPASEGQRRFLSKSPEFYLRLWEETEKNMKSTGVTMGWGIHSLRACPQANLKILMGSAPQGIPVHLHIAEQEKEVRACESFYGKRPVEWLMDEVDLNEKFHLVHGTHTSAVEMKRLLTTKAQVVLCPSTEGNLGDGFFDSIEWQQGGGRWSIGTDSHVGINPFEELRWLEYSARLRKQRRNVLCAIGNDCGETLFEQALSGGAAAAGQQTGEFTVGEMFNAVVWDSQAPLFGCPARYRLSQMIFASDASQLYGTFTRGKWRVRNQKHEAFETLTSEFQRCLTRLWKKN